MATKEKGRIVNPGMGGFLNPPTHPEHEWHVQTDLHRRPENRGGMSLTAATEATWLDSATRAEAKKLLKSWQPPPPNSPEIVDWRQQVLGYFRNMYRNPNAPKDEQWNASTMIVDRDRDPIANADDHAGVHFIRKFYPDYMPTEADFGAYWGSRPESATVHESGRRAPADEHAAFIDEAQGKYGLERISLENISVGVPRRLRRVFAFRMGIDEQGIAKGGFHWIPADKPLEAEKLWFEHTGRRITLQQRARRRAHEMRAPAAGRAVRALTRLDTFTRQYMETALWSSTDNADDSGGEPLDKNYGIDDIAPETRDKMIDDCIDFQQRYRYMLDNAYGEGGIDSGRAGHNFWLSRNGHGAGFFDDNLDDLQKAAESYGEFYLYVGDDGMIYGS